MSNVDVFDVIVVGAGMVGAAQACGLAQAGFSVAVVEASDNPPEYPGKAFDNRVSALTRASENLLRSLGVWGSMQAQRVFPYTDMHVWDATGSGKIHFDAAELGEPALGHIVENRVTTTALWECFGSQPLIRLYAGEKVCHLLREQNMTEVRMASGLCLRAALVVAADGRQSPVRQLLNISTTGWRYDQHALVATVASSESHQQTAWQRFMPEGPLAFLPLADRHCSIVWSTSPQQADALMAMDEDDFCQAVTLAGESCIGEILSVESRAVFPLELNHADHYFRQGCVLVGDAAHAVHPLAGQGVNLGFLDVATLIDVLIEARQQKRHLGSDRVLRRFELRRKSENMLMLASMDAFKRLFGNTRWPLKVLRNSGLLLVDRLTPLKTFLAHYAMGAEGELPVLSRRFRNP